MPYNGSGLFVRETPVSTGVVAWADAVLAGDTTITTDDHDFHDQDIAGGLTDCVTRDGQSPATANLPMGGFHHTGVSDAIARTQYASAGQSQDGTLLWGGTAGGTANALTIALAPAVPAYVAGQRFAFIVGTTNTSAATINSNAAGVIGITKNGTTALTGGEMVAGTIVTIIYDGTQFQLQGAQPIFNNHIAGLGISNDVGTPNTKIDVAAGQATDSTNAIIMSFAGSAKTIDMTANGAGGLDTGSIGASKWYAALLISGTSGTSVMATLEAAATALAPTMPTGYSFYRYIGSFATNGSSHILGFTQIGQTFLKTAPTTDLSTSGAPTTPALLSLSVPLGINVRPSLTAVVNAPNVGTAQFYQVFSPPSNRITGAQTGAPYLGDFEAISQVAGAFLQVSVTNVITDTSGRVYHCANAGSTSVTLGNNGWIDPYVAQF